MRMLMMSEEQPQHINCNDKKKSKEVWHEHIQRVKVGHNKQAECNNFWWWESLKLSTKLIAFTR